MQNVGMSLRIYNRKRKFSQTPEPKGKKQDRDHGALKFVVQMHDASRMHFDFRLEVDGVYKSWAVPKGPSLNPLDQRLAVQVEDHPLEYGKFEGIIPRGNYGAGTVMLWDRGTYQERSTENRRDGEMKMLEGLAKGHITFVLKGEKLKGEFALIKLKKSNEQNIWLMVKKRDEFASFKRRKETIEPLSVKSGRTLAEIAGEAENAGEVWLSKRKVQQSASKKPSREKSKLRATRARPTDLAKPQPAAMPRRIKPMLATLGRKNPTDGEWFFEEDHGGLRAIAEVEKGRVHLYSKSGLPFDKRFPQIMTELKSLESQVVLDGEVVQNKTLHVYRVFDILYQDGRDLRESPLKARKEILKKTLSKGKLVQTTMPSKSSKFPIIAKNLASPYHSGTSNEWIYLPKENSKRQTDQSEPPLTHLEKIYFPEDGYTKGDLLNYYREIAPKILPYLQNRPESLNRHPNGINQPGFYQKDMTGHIPKWFKTERIFSEGSGKTINYPVVQDVRSLLYIVNLGCIEIHPWFSRIGKLDQPDFIVLDLDPDDNEFGHVVEVAQEFHRVLDAIGAKNFCKTSGATGIHIGVPVGAKQDFDTARDFAQKICRVIHKKFPSTTSLERNPNRRRKKIYLDFMQNRRGQTLAAPFCIRPRPRAPVSMPLTWSELASVQKPEQFNIENAAGRILKRPDPWRGVMGPGINLTKCIKVLSQKFGPA